MDNATRRQILERVKQLGYPNTVEALQNPQILDQYEQQLQAQSQQQQQPIQQPEPVSFPTPPVTTPNYKVPQPRQSEAKPLVMSFNQTAPQLMADGGLKDPPKKKEPRVISDPEEFKIANQAYADSLSTYNYTVDTLNALKKFKYSDKNSQLDYNKILDSSRPKTNISPIDVINTETYVEKNKLDLPNPRWYNIPIYKKPTQPVVFEPPLEKIEPLPIKKLPIQEPQLEPINLTTGKNNTRRFDSYETAYDQRSGKLKQGTYYYDENLKKWQYRDAEPEEVEYERSKGAIEQSKPALKKSAGVMKFKNGGKKCYTCSSSKMKVLYNKANYKK